MIFALYISLTHFPIYSKMHQFLLSTAITDEKNRKPDAVCLINEHAGGGDGARKETIPAR